MSRRTPAPAPPFKGMAFVLSPSLDKKVIASLTKTIENGSGKIFKTFTATSATHVVVTDAKDVALDKLDQTVPRTYVDTKWIESAGKSGLAQQSSQTKPAAAAAATKKTAAASKQATKPTKSASKDDAPAPKRGGRRAATQPDPVDDDDEDDDEEEEEENEKKPQPKTKKAAPAPAPKRGGRRAAPPVTSSDDEENDDDKKPAPSAAKRAKANDSTAVKAKTTATKATTTAKKADTKKVDTKKKASQAAPVVQSNDSEDEEEDEDDDDDAADDAADDTAQSQQDDSDEPLLPVAADRYCPEPGYVVYRDPETEVLYDFMLNQTNINANNNKYYLVQVLQGTPQTTFPYAVWLHYGRVGEAPRPSTSKFDPCNSLAAAISAARSKVQDKTKYPFQEILNAAKDANVLPGVPGKYTWLSRDLKERKKAKETNAPKKERQKVAVTLHPRVLELMKLIADRKMVVSGLSDLGLDAQRMPLGQLRPEVLKSAQAVLKKIETAIKKKTGDLKALTSQYYTLIPHNFGRSVPQTIETETALKKEIDLVDGLFDVERGQQVLDAQEDAEDNFLLGMQKAYDMLNCDLRYVDPKSKLSQIINEYAKNTVGNTHWDRQNIEFTDIFEVIRPGESERMAKWMEDHPDHNWNRQLLWHGSRVQNFTGILSTGLRLPKDLVNVPRTGSMFAPGCYFADAFSKSAGYCSYWNNQGCILLCEVILGGNECLFQADPWADQSYRQDVNASVMGVGRNAPTDNASKWLAWPEGAAVSAGAGATKRKGKKSTAAPQPDAEGIIHTDPHDPEFFDYDQLLQDKILSDAENVSILQKHNIPVPIMTSGRDDNASLVKLPMGKLQARTDDCSQHAGLFYNEFIVYNVEQVRIKYIIRMNNKN